MERRRRETRDATTLRTSATCCVVGAVAHGGRSAPGVLQHLDSRSAKRDSVRFHSGELAERRSVGRQYCGQSDRFAHRHSSSDGIHNSGTNAHANRTCPHANTSADTASGIARSAADVTRSDLDADAASAHTDRRADSERSATVRQRSGTRLWTPLDGRDWGCSGNWMFAGVRDRYGGESPAIRERDDGLARYGIGRS